MSDITEDVKLAYYKRAEENLARGTFEEEQGNIRYARLFYYDAVVHYRMSDAPKDTIEVAENAYKRCRSE